MTRTTNTMSFLFVAALSSSLLMAPLAQADSLSRASTGSVAASATLVQGSGQLIKAGGDFAIASIETVADGVIVVLQHLSTGVNSSVHLTGTVITASLVAVGTAIQASAVTGGTILSAGSQVIGFVTDTDGARISHASPYGVES